MASAKSVTGIILFAKNETTYNAGASLSGTTDAIRLVDPRPEFSIDYTYDGSRGQANWSGGNFRHGSPTGRTTQGTVNIEVQGSGSAYQASSNTPPNWHRFLLASGFSGSFATNTWTYQPVPLGTTPSSLAMAVYTRGELWPVSGSYGNVTFKADGPQPAVFSFDLMGMLGDPSDQSSPPSRTYLVPTVIPPNATDISLSLNGWTSAVVRSVEYSHGLEIVPRTDINAATGHNGYTIGKRAPKLTVLIETPLLSDYNYVSINKNATVQAISFQIGSTTGNKVGFSLPYCYLMNISPSSDGPTALTTLEFVPTVSAADAEDDVSITAN